MSIDENKQVKLEKCERALEALKIPVSHRYHSSCPYSGYVRVDDLYDILMDEERLRVLVSKVRNKAFW
jgi:hypothetical protein